MQELHLFHPQPQRTVVESAPYILQDEYKHSFSREVYEDQKAKVLAEMDMWGSYTKNETAEELHIGYPEMGLDIFIFPSHITVRKVPSSMDRELVDDLVFFEASRLARITGYKVFDPMMHQEFVVPSPGKESLDIPPWLLKLFFAYLILQLTAVLLAVAFQHWQ